MKANQKSLLANDTRAQVGIGTMIVFIATILVAATAAAVLIDTSGKLQERSSSTGNEATKQVASNLVLKQVYGNRDDGVATQDDIQTLHILVSLAPGASSVDLEQLRIGLIEGTQSANIQMEATNDCDAGTPDPTNDHFCTTSLRDPKGTYTQAGGPWVLSAGGLVEIQIPLDIADAGNGMTFSPRDSVSALLRPEVGSPLIADFITPTSFGEDDIVMLR